MEFAHIEKHLSSPALNQAWQTQANEWTETDEQGRGNALSFIHGRRDYAVKTLEEIGDPDQIRETLAILYIEIKSQWIMLNTVVNYQLFRKGKGDGETILKASLLSSFLQMVEELLTPNDISAITAFLSAPIRQNVQSPELPGQPGSAGGAALEDGTRLAA